MAVHPMSRWKVQEDRLYDAHHQWAQVEQNLVTVGITDYMQDTAGDILYLSLPEPGTEMVKGQPMGSLESGKWVGQLYAPFSGVVIAANQYLMEEPGTLNQDPYHRGWLIKAKPHDERELAELLSPAGYRAVLHALDLES